MTSSDLATTQRTRLRRLAKRGHFDRETINSILDATPLCHVGCVMNGAPVVLPTLQWRDGNRVYWHGSSASRALHASKDSEVCLTVSLLDGLVLARSAFHHSANYRSVMVFGRAEIVSDPDEKLVQLHKFVDGLYPGRWAELRPVHDRELRATTVLSLKIQEASAKIRTGGPIDDEEDYSLPIWAGVIPMRQSYDKPEPDPRNLPGVVPPQHLPTAGE